MHGVLNIDEIKNELHSLVVLCETNVLSLISQRLNNYYQIKTKQSYSYLGASDSAELNVAPIKNSRRAAPRRPQIH